MKIAGNDAKAQLDPRAVKLATELTDKLFGGEDKRRGVGWRVSLARPQLQGAMIAAVQAAYNDDADRVRAGAKRLQGKAMQAAIVLAIVGVCELACAVWMMVHR